MDEDIETARMIAQYIIRTSTNDHKRLFLRGVLEEIAYTFVKTVVRYG